MDRISYKTYKTVWTNGFCPRFITWLRIIIYIHIDMIQHTSTQNKNIQLWLQQKCDKNCNKCV